MELKNQVVSLELAKKMKELGFEQESLFYWYEAPKGLWKLGNVDEMMNDGIMNGTTDASKYSIKHYSAYTVAELGEMLPSAIKKEGRLYYITPSANGNGLKFMDYTAYNNSIGTFLRAYPLVKAKTEADARAKMLIYLAENNLLTNK